MDPLDDLRAKIAEHGWAVRIVADRDPAKCLAYTIGLTAFGHPEVVVTGLPAEPGKAFLNIAGQTVSQGRGRFVAGQTTTELAEGPPMPIIKAIDTGGLTAVEEIYGRVDAVQIVWTDSRGHLPWDVDYATLPGSQPLLGPKVA